MSEPRRIPFRLLGRRFHLDVFTGPDTGSWILYERVTVTRPESGIVFNPIARGLARTTIGAAWAGVREALRYCTRRIDEAVARATRPIRSQRDFLHRRTR